MTDAPPDAAADPNTAVDAADTADPLADLDEQPVLLFDGVCNLCNGLIQWIIPRDPAGKLKFAPLQSELGTAIQQRHGLDPTDLDSVLLVEGPKLYTKSTAAIRVAEILGWPYLLLRAGRPLPRTLRDRIYDFVADNRYDWFGKKDQCMVPDEDVSDRFIE